jgi:hypothetical protein
VALVLQWWQDYPNKRPPTRATAISEMGQSQPSAPFQRNDSQVILFGQLLNMIICRSKFSI